MNLLETCKYYIGLLKGHLFSGGKRSALSGAGIVAFIIFLVWLFSGTSDDFPRYEFTTVNRGDVVETISATGKVNPIRVVEVGSELSGTIVEMFVDFNDEVSEGQIIARIDPSSFRSQVNQAQAQLQVAKSNLSIRTASLKRAKANLVKARNDHERKKSLIESGHISESTAEEASAAYTSAAADMIIAEAEIVNAKASVSQNEAALELAQLDLAKTVIRAPISGVVIKRSVSLGQTIAAQMTTPVLFVIAQSLEDLQIEAQIDEADVGKVAVNQAIIFSVPAYPEDIFRGQVKQVRYAPNEDADVVTYSVIIHAANPDIKLLPGMTATVNIVVNRQKNILRVANNAVNFRPLFVPRGARPEPVLWQAGDGGIPRPVPVTLGLRGDDFTEIKEGPAEGVQIIRRRLPTFPMP